jgi:hypothetical protein
VISRVRSGFIGNCIASFYGHTTEMEKVDDVIEQITVKVEANKMPGEKQWKPVWKR